MNISCTCMIASPHIRGCHKTEAMVVMILKLMTDDTIMSTMTDDMIISAVSFSLITRSHHSGAIEDNTCRIGSGAHWVKLFWVLPLLIILHGFYWNALPILGWFHWLLMRCIKGFGVVFFHPSSGSSYVNFDRFCICFQFPFCVALFLNFHFFFTWFSVSFFQTFF